MTALSFVVLTAPRALAAPAFKGRKAQGAAAVLSVFIFGHRVTAISANWSADNDNVLRGLA